MTTKSKNSSNEKPSTSKIISSDDKTTPVKKNYIWLILAGLTVITLIAYSPIFNNEFLNWDDQNYVTQNPDIQSLHLKNIKAFFLNQHETTFLPLTMVSFAIDYQLGELNPVIYTSTNLLLHIINTLLVFWLILFLLKSYTNKTNEHYNQYFLASITALFFAIHPLNVESVAFISERKNLLFTLFFILSLIYYIKYINESKLRWYLISILLFIFSLFSKGSAIALPLTIVAIDYLFKRKLFSKKLILEKIPYLILSFIIGLIIIHEASKIKYFQSHVKFYEQLVLSLSTFTSYIYKILLPVNLSAYYPYPQKVTFIYWFYCMVTVLIGILLIRYWKRLPRIISFAILFYLANIIFFIPFFHVGEAIMADHYIYIPCIGFFLIVSIVIMNTTHKFRLVYWVLGVLFILCGFATHERVKVWNNSSSFWDELINYDNNIPLAWNNRGLIKKDNGDYSGALDDYRTAIEISPNYGVAYYNKANIERMKGGFESALNDYNMAIQIMPDHKDSYFGRGIVLYWLNKKQEALADFTTAIKLDPAFGNAFYYRGIIKSEDLDYKGAIYDLNSAVRIDPRFKEAYNYRGLILSKSGMLQESYSDYSKAIELDPAYAEAYFNRGNLTDLNNNSQAALNDLNQAIFLQPRYLEALILRARIKIKMGNYDEAIKDCDAALRLDKKSTVASNIKSDAYKYLKNKKH